MSRKQIAGSRSSRLWIPDAIHHHLERLDDVRGPGARLLRVIHGQEGLFRERRDPVGEFGVPDVLRTFALRQGGTEHLGLPPCRFLLGDPADAVALDAEQPLDSRRAEALGELHLDERHDRDLVLAQPIVGRGRRHADRLPDDRQQLVRDAGPLADLPERLVGQGGEPLVRGRVEEGQRERAALDGGPDGFERDPGILERPAHQHAPDVAAREAIRLIESEDAELDQPVEIGRLDPDPLGSFLA